MVLGWGRAGGAVAGSLANGRFGRAGGMARRALDGPGYIWGVVPAPVRASARLAGPCMASAPQARR